MAKRRHTILVVDDEPDVVKSVQDLLRLDYRVLGATSAGEGEEILLREEVHVVMTDQRMPGVSGVEFLHKVRGDHPDAVRLLFTGYADIHAVIDAINQGNVYRYITKPWDPDELETVIREACERFDLLVERKQMLAELKEKNDALERVNQQLREAGELKSAFIQVASHELRTPLTILTGLSKLALRVATNGETSQQERELLQRIEQSADRLGRLVNQIVSQLAAEKFENVLDRTEVNVAELVRAAADDVRPLVEMRRQTLKLDAPDDLGTMPLDELKMRDTLNHLLLNAIKFTADGGEISVRATRDGANADGGNVGGANAGGGGGSLRVAVTDNGCGIDDQCLPRLFEPFFTGFDVSRHSSGTFEHNRKGLGLGLSVVKSFVEMHGGKIDVQTEVDKGSTFTITLPNVPMTAREQSSDAAHDDDATREVASSI